MRDRLDELRQKAQEDPDPEAEIISDPLSGVNEPDDPTEVDFTTPRAVVFEEEPVIENFLCEAQRIRDEITELDADVSYDLLLTLQYYRTVDVDVVALSLSHVCDTQS